MTLFSQAAAAKTARSRCHTSTGMVLTVALTLLAITDVTRSLPHTGPRQNAADAQPPLPLTSVLADPVPAREAPDAKQAMLSRLIALSGYKPSALASPESGSAPQSPPDNAKQPASDWFEWARFSASPIVCSVSSDTHPAAVLAFGVHNEDGTCIALWNSSDRPAPFELKLKTSNGVFRIERLCFAPGRGAKQAETPETHSSVPTCAGNLRRMEGIDTASPTVIVKRGILAAGEISLIRTTDTAREARLALMDLEQSLRELSQTAPGPAARLRKIQKECDKYTDAIRSGTESDRQKRLSCIHRLILLYAQAEAQHRNNQNREKVTGDPAARTMSSVERLASALAETSAVISGLVPQVEVLPGNAQEITVQVSLSNSGGHSVDKVKLGLDTAALPTGVSCTPDDAAYFGALGPGQSVRAEFKLKCTQPDANGLQEIASRCVADVSYFTNGAPAHLRPKGW
jgi:hypothetical protein